MRVSVDIILGFVPSDCGCVSSLLAVSVTFFGCLRDLVLAVDSRVRLIVLESEYAYACECGYHSRGCPK